jgi:hypothetical protein
MRDVLIVLLIALIIVVGGWKFWSYQQNLDGDNLAPNTTDESATAEATITNESVVDVSTEPSDVVGGNEVKIVSPETTVATQTITIAGVKISDQKAGSAVIVSEVALPATGWIAIRDYKDGKMGNTLGAKLLNKGTVSNVAVDLLRAMISGNSYVAVPLKDNGDGLYKGVDDVPFNDAGGKPIMTVFKAN